MEAEILDLMNLEKLIVSELDRAYRVAMAVTGSEQEAAEAVQDACASVLSAGVPEVEVRSPRGWFLKAVVHSARKSQKSEMRRRAREEKWAVGINGRKELPVDQAARNELAAKLREALGELNEQHRLAVVLHHGEGLTQAEVAAVLEAPQGTVGANISRGLERLRALLKRRGVEVAPALVLGELFSRSLPPAPAALLSAVRGLLAGAGAATPAVTVTVTATAAGTGLALGWKLLAGLFAAALLGLGAFGAWKPGGLKAPKSPATTVARLPSVQITPRGASAWRVFDQLALKGLRVVYLGRKRKVMGRARYGRDLWVRRKLLVPAEVRDQTMDGLEFVRAVASFHRLKVRLAGKHAVLYAGAADADIRRVREGLCSKDPAQRERAAWLAGWQEDVRVVPLLAAALGDRDADVARMASRSLHRLNLGACLAVADKEADRVWELVGKDLSGWRAGSHEDLIRELGWLGTVRARQALFRCIAEDIERQKHSKRKFMRTRDRAFQALGSVGGEEVLRFFARQWGAQKYARFEREYTGAGMCRLVARGLLTREGQERGKVKEFLAPYAPPNLADVKERMKKAGRYVAGGAAYDLGALRLDGEIVGLLRKALARKDKSVRFSAVLAIGDLGNPETAKLAARVLNDPDKMVRSGALTVFNQHGAEKFLPEIRRALEHGDNFTRGMAVKALECSGRPEAVALLEKCLKSSHPDVRERASGAIAAIDGEKSLAHLEVALKDREKCVRLSAVNALGRIGGRRAVVLLEKALDDADANTAAWAVRALGKQLSRPALEILAKGAVHKNRIVRSVAVQQLGYWKPDPEGARRILFKATSDRDKDVRRYALSSIGFLGGREALKTLLVALGDEDPLVRRSSAWGLGRVGGKKARDALLRRVEIETDKKARGAIVYSLSKCYPGDPLVKDVLAKLPPVTMVKPPPPPEPPEFF
jgi:RNA polymerase sigma factor (sigma-70 family)